MSKLQAPDKEATVRFTVDMFVGRTPQIVGAGSYNWAQESGYSAGCCARGRVEGSRGVRIIFLLMAITVIREWRSLGGTDWVKKQKFSQGVGSFH
ncbi:hypothetical protein QUA20_02895 [Microcoleus sp. Pol7_A1]|uniref:hypothetical protein n=1 Tax=Microcoleus sp. Pol7_A1 TaxID=2818893 RepID=UPI002FD7164D